MPLRDPPAGVIERWQPALDRIAPKTARGHSHLRLLWEPGEEWQPVERWVIWEMMRPETAPRVGIWEDLEGPPPRSFGRWDATSRRFVRQRRFSVNQRQWELYQETGLYGRPVWIVQGEKGGHKRHWNDIEQNLVMLKLGTSEVLEPPAPGDLAYAEPDRRTIDLLHGLDMVRRFGDMLRVFSHSEVMRRSWDAREREVAREMAEGVWAWLGDQVEESMTLTRAQTNALWDNADPDKDAPDYELEREQFMEQVASTAI